MVLQYRPLSQRSDPLAGIGDVCDYFPFVLYAHRISVVKYGYVHIHIYFYSISPVFAYLFIVSVHEMLFGCLASEFTH